LEFCRKGSLNIQDTKLLERRSREQLDGDMAMEQLDTEMIWMTLGLSKVMRSSVDVLKID
jgi:hypothetical protein